MIQKHRIYIFFGGVLFLCSLVGGLFFFNRNTSSLPIVSDTKMKSPDEKEAINNMMPSKFRCIDKKSIASIKAKFNINGLKNLKILGSGQFTSKQFENIFKNIISSKNIVPSNFVVVDLRGEQHILINGFPVTFFSDNFSHSFGNTVVNVQEDERDQVARLLKNPKAIVHYVVEKGKNGTLGETIQAEEIAQQVNTEQAVIQKFGVQYVRFAITDHTRPSDVIVDQLVKFMNNVSENTWLYVHCRGGSGRTSTFMTMYDMIKNGKKVSKEDILARQVALGGKDLFKVKQKINDDYRNDSSIARCKFIDQFYKYVRANDGLGVQSWSAWVKKTA